MSFQDELRKNIPKEGDVDEIEQEIIRIEADKIYSRVKSTLMDNVAKKAYTVENGKATVSCALQMPNKYLHVDCWDNASEIWANNRKIFKNPFLKPNASKTFSVVSSKEKEYHLLCSRLEALAQKDGISFSVILYESTFEKERPFPTKLVGVGECFPNYRLAAKFSTTFTL